MEFWLTRIFFQRSLAAIYLIGFLVAAFQIRPLVGSHGLLPMRLYLQRITFWESPSLFFWNCSERFLLGTAWAGVVLALFALSGISESSGFLVSATVWTLRWALYLSLVNTGQTFYGFSWETLLLETGFLAIFLGPRNMAPPVIVFWLSRWPPLAFSGVDVKSSSFW